MPIAWEVPVRLRADFLFYKGLDLQGRRSIVRLYLKGRSGQVEPEHLSSMVVRAPMGTRVTLMTRPGERWMEHPWRQIRILPDTSVPGDKTPLPGVRIPDLDYLDDPRKKRSRKDFQESYRLVDSPELWAGWTCGRVGAEPLKGHVRAIRVEPPDAGG